MTSVNITIATTSYFPFCNDTTSPPKTVTITTYSALMIFSLIGNAFIVTVFYRNKQLRTPVHYFIVNMAISDLLIPLIFLPGLIGETYYDREWLVIGIVGSILCKLVWSIRCVSMVVSVLSMVAMAVDRFHAIVFAMKPALISQRSCRLLIVIIWIISAALRVHYVNAKTLVSYENKVYCVLYPKDTSKTEYILILCFFSLTATLLAVMYSSISVFLNRQENNANMGTAANENRSKENRKATCMLVTIVLTVFAVFLPFHVTSSLLVFQSGRSNVSCFWFWFGETLSTHFTVVNPVVLYIFNEKYRKGFGELLRCPWLYCNNNGNDCFHVSVSPLGNQGN